MLVGDEFGQVGTDPQMQVLLGRASFVGLGGQFLQREPGSNAAQRVLEFQHQAVAQALDQTPSMRPDKVVFCLADEPLPTRHKVIFVLLHQADRLHDVHHHEDLGLAGKREWRSVLVDIVGVTARKNF